TQSVQGDVVVDEPDAAARVPLRAQNGERSRESLARRRVQRLLDLPFEDAHPAVLSGVIVDRALLTDVPAQDEHLEVLVARHEVAGVDRGIEAREALPVRVARQVVAENPGHLGAAGIARELVDEIALESEDRL